MTTKTGRKKPPSSGTKKRKAPKRPGGGTKGGGTKGGGTKGGGTKGGGTKGGGTKSRAKAPGRTGGTQRRKRPRPQNDVTVAVLERTRSDNKRARDVIESIGYQIAEESTAAEIVQRLTSDSPPDVLLFGAGASAAVMEAARANGIEPPVIVLSLGGSAETAQQRFQDTGADLFVLRPHAKDGLAAALYAATAIAAERRKQAAAQATEEHLRDRLLHYGQADAITGFQHFDFFKQLLVMELKRAKRYGYPIAACLVALDAWSLEAARPQAGADRRWRTRVAKSIASCIRDIDVPVDFSEDRFLVFLPYTDIVGAERVGGRIAAAVREFSNKGDGTSVSIGIAALTPGSPVSFARLMRDASAAVRAAQLKGGDRVVVRKRR